MVFRSLILGIALFLNGVSIAEERGEVDDERFVPTIDFQELDKSLSKAYSSRKEFVDMSLAAQAAYCTEKKLVGSGCADLKHRQNLVVLLELIVESGGIKDEPMARVAAETLYASLGHLEVYETRGSTRHIRKINSEIRDEIEAYSEVLKSTAIGGGYVYAQEFRANEIREFALGKSKSLVRIYSHQSPPRGPYAYRYQKGVISTTTKTMFDSAARCPYRLLISEELFSKRNARQIQFITDRLTKCSVAILTEKKSLREIVSLWNKSFSIGLNSPIVVPVERILSGALVMMDHNENVWFDWTESQLLDARRQRLLERYFSDK